MSHSAIRGQEQVYLYRRDALVMSPPRLQLRDHPLNLSRLLTCGFGAQILQRVHVLGFQSFFTSFDQHTALHPHLHALRHR
jgi:hypothetical protein